MHTYKHTYIHTNIRAYMHTCIHTYIHTYMHTFTQACIHTDIRTYIHTFIHACILTYLHTYMHIYTHRCMHAYIHAYNNMTHMTHVQAKLPTNCAGSRITILVLWCMCCSDLYCVAVCCTVLQCIMVCCSALQRVSVCCSVLQCRPNCLGTVLKFAQQSRYCVPVCCIVLQRVLLCCSELQFVLLGAVLCCSVLQSIAVCSPVLQCVAVCVAWCCAVLQCVAVCGIVLQGVVLATWMSHITSSHWVISHIHASCHISTLHVTYLLVPWRIKESHIACANNSCNTLTCHISNESHYISMSHITYISTSRVTYQWVMSQGCCERVSAMWPAKLDRASKLSVPPAPPFPPHTQYAHTLNMNHSYTYTLSSLQKSNWRTKSVPRKTKQKNEYKFKQTKSVRLIHWRSQLSLYRMSKKNGIWKIFIKKCTITSNTFRNVFSYIFRLNLSPPSLKKSLRTIYSQWNMTI